MVIGLQRQIAIGACSALTVPRSLLRRNPLDGLELANLARTARIERAWIVVVALRVTGADLHFIGRRRAVLIERARSCLRDDAGKQQGNRERGKDFRARMHGRLVRERRLLCCANYDAAIRSLTLHHARVAHVAHTLLVQRARIAGGFLWLARR